MCVDWVYLRQAGSAVSFVEHEMKVRLAQKMGTVSVSKGHCSMDLITFLQNCPKQEVKYYLPKYRNFANHFILKKKELLSSENNHLLK
jgi:hypothetical protein